MKKQLLKVCLHVEKNGARLDANRLLERRKPISRSAFGLTLLMREPSIISFASIDQEYRDGGSGGAGGMYISSVRPKADQLIGLRHSKSSFASRRVSFFSTCKQILAA